MRLTHGASREICGEALRFHDRGGGPLSSAELSVLDFEEPADASRQPLLHHALAADEHRTSADSDSPSLLFLTDTTEY